MHYLLIGLSLYVFWLLLSGYFLPLLLALGGLSILIVVYFLKKMDVVDFQPISFRPGLRFFRYMGWLAGQVVLSNIDVARRVWSPKQALDPRWEKIDTQVDSPLEKTLYANSITLTPGTLTTDVCDKHFMIHSLSASGIEALRKGEMQRRIREIGL